VAEFNIGLQDGLLSLVVSK